MAKTGFLHTVYFWLADGGGEAEAKELREGCRLYLPNIPTVLRLEAGLPAGTERDVVDNSYGVALLVEFADAAGHEIYQEHPDHTLFIEKCKHLWSRVQVFDTLL